MASISIHVEGLDEIGSKLSQLEPKLANKLMRTAMKAGGKILLDEVVARTPINTDVPTQGSTALEPGELKASMSERVAVQPSDGTSQVYVGPSKDVGYVARFVEFGHALVKGSKGNKKVIGQVPAAPFLRPALEARANDAVQAIADSLEDNLEGLV